MSIASYSELKTKVVDYLHRPALSTNVADFVSLAEAYLFRELDIKALETTATGTTSGNTIALPSTFNRITRVSVTAYGMESSLDYYAQPEDDAAALSAPAYFSLQANAIRLHDAPGTGYTYTLYYIPVIAPLSDTNTSNWLLVNADDLYLYASALYGARWVRNKPEIETLTPLVAGLLESVRNKAQRRQIPAGGSLQIKPRRRW